MAVLVVADHDNKTLRDTTLKTVTAAQKLGEVDVLVLGSGCRAAADEAAKVLAAWAGARLRGNGFKAAPDP